MSLIDEDVFRYHILPFLVDYRRPVEEIRKEHATEYLRKLPVFEFTKLNVELNYQWREQYSSMVLNIFVNGVLMLHVIPARDTHDFVIGNHITGLIKFGVEAKALRVTITMLIMSLYNHTQTQGYYDNKTCKIYKFDMYKSILSDIESTYSGMRVTGILNLCRAVAPNNCECVACTMYSRYAWPPRPVASIVDTTLHRVYAINEERIRKMHPTHYEYLVTE